jgi:hypothetical protein
MGIGDRRIKPRDHIRAGRARRADANADIAELGAGVTLRHVGGALCRTGRCNHVDRVRYTSRHTPRKQSIQYAALFPFYHQCLWNT